MVPSLYLVGCATRSDAPVRKDRNAISRANNRFLPVGPVTIPIEMDQAN